MKIIKKVTNSSKSSSIVANASSKIAEYVDKNFCDKKQDTSTIKVSARITGLKPSDAHAAFIKGLANNNKNSGNNGSFSIKIPSEMFEKEAERLTKAVTQMHGHIDFIIDQGIAKLPEEEKAKGKVVAKQNYLRIVIIDLVGPINNAKEVVESYLSEKGEIYVPQTAQLELHIVGGCQSFNDQGDQAGWRKDSYTLSDGTDVPCWRRNIDLYGRKRVPLAEDEQIKWAMDQVFDLSKSFEDKFANADINGVNVIINRFCEWAESLAHKDFTPVRNVLTPEEKHEIEVKAAKYAGEILKVAVPKE